MSVKMQSFYPHLQPRRSDIVVLVIGMAGSGKSTFISLCTGTNVPVGDGLEACTQKVGIYKTKWSSSIDIYLVDTPSFGDMSASDTDTLKEIATFLANSYRDEIQLNGILYLRPIINSRVERSEIKSLHILRKLCGNKALQNLSFVSTMWDLVNPLLAEADEHKMMNWSEFWGTFMERGSLAFRHDSTRASAMRVLGSIVKMGKVTMSIQEEMVDNHKALYQTSAGTQLEYELQEEREKLQREMLAAQSPTSLIPGMDQIVVEEFGHHRSELSSRIEKLIEESKKLKLGIKQVQVGKSTTVQNYEEQQAGPAETPQDRTDAHDTISLHDFRPKFPGTTLQADYDAVLKKIYAHHGIATGQAQYERMYEDAEVWLDNFAASLECWYADIGAADSLDLLNNTLLGTEIQMNLRTISENLSSTTSDLSKAIARDREQQNHNSASDALRFRSDNSVVAIKLIVEALEQLQEPVSQTGLFLATQDPPKGPLMDLKSRIDETYTRTIHTS